MCVALNRFHFRRHVAENECSVSETSYSWITQPKFCMFNWVQNWVKGNDKMKVWVLLHTSHSWVFCLPVTSCHGDWSIHLVFGQDFYLGMGLSMPRLIYATCTLYVTYSLFFSTGIYLFHFLPLIDSHLHCSLMPWSVYPLPFLQSA